MAALSQERNTLMLAGGGPAVRQIEIEVKGGVKIYAGALVSVKSSLARPGTTESGAKGWGRAEKTADNLTGIDGAVKVIIREGVFKFDNSPAGTDFIDPSAMNLGNPCYIVDDQTVAKTDGGGTRSPAGGIYRVDTDGVWVDMKIG